MSASEREIQEQTRRTVILTTLQGLPQWNETLLSHCDIMTTYQLELLADQLRLASKGGGVLKRDFGSDTRIDRILPGGNIAVSPFGLSYPSRYVADFSGKQEPVLHRVLSFGDSGVTAEIRHAIFKREKEQLLNCRKVHGRSTLARYTIEPNGDLALSGVGINYNYTSGVYKSAPSAFMSEVDSATNLDAVIVDPKGKARYQYNQDGRSVAIPTNGDTFNIREEGGPYPQELQVTTAVKGDRLTIQMYKGEVPFSVPLRESMDGLYLAQFRLGPNAEKESGFPFIMDTVVKRFEDVAPRINS